MLINNLLIHAIGWEKLYGRMLETCGNCGKVHQWEVSPLYTCRHPLVSTKSSLNAFSLALTVAVLGQELSDALLKFINQNHVCMQHSGPFARLVNACMWINLF